jgi:hypothetical protein
MASPVEARPYEADDGVYFDGTGALRWRDADTQRSGRGRGRHVRDDDDDDDYRESRGGRVARGGRYSHYGLGPRPRRWCGWWMRSQRGGGPELNVAWNWRHWGRPTVPQVGAVVVWRHHVGEIVGRAANGQWIVRSGNDGGRVRTRARSVAGAVFRI